MQSVEQEVNEFFDGYRTPTVDSPPSELSEEPEQVSLIDEDTADAYLSFDAPSRFKIEMSLKLTGDHGVVKTHTLPVVFAEKVPAERVEEIIELAMQSAYFKRRLRGVVGQPLEESQQGEMFNGSASANDANE